MILVLAGLERSSRSATVLNVDFQLDVSKRPVTGVPRPFNIGIAISGFGSRPAISGRQRLVASLSPRVETYQPDGKNCGRPNVAAMRTGWK